MSTPEYDGENGPPLSDTELGQQLVQQLHGVIRALRLYDRSNRTVQAQIQALAETFIRIGGEEVLLLSLGDYFYLNGTRLRPTGSTMALARAFAGELRSRGLAGVRAQSGLGIGELETFLVLLTRCSSPDQTEAMVRQLGEHGLRQIFPIREKDLGGTTAAQSLDDANAHFAEDERGRAKVVYRTAVLGAERVLALSASKGRPAFQQARRVVQPIVDRLLHEELSLIGLTALRDHDEHTYAHCVNVSVLSIRMGQILGLGRAELANLGVAALLHDIGKLQVPLEVLQCPGKLGDDEWNAIRRHPLEGLKYAFRQAPYTRLTLETARVALQHHVGMDGRGYPSGLAPESLSTGSRIVAVADLFDAVTAHRSYRARPLTSFEALHLIVRSETHKFDPAPVWALVRTVGRYPAGTVMELESGAVVLALSPNHEQPSRPHCRVLVRADGSAPADDAPEHLDPLPESDRIVRVLAPEELSDDGTLRKAA